MADLVGLKLAGTPSSQATARKVAGHASGAARNAWFGSPAGPGLYSKQLALAASPPAATVTVAHAPSAELVADLQKELPGRPFVVSPEKVQALKAKFNLDDHQLLLGLISTARPSAQTPISQFHVGAAGMGASGAIYLGCNLEFEGAAINQTVHGEQFVTTNALNHGETSLKMLAVSAEPCGHCRQWLNELNQAKGLEIIVPEAADETLPQLLPHDFGPQDLGVKGGLMAPQQAGLHLIDAHTGDDMRLDNAATDAANRSYAPYSHDISGLGIETSDGKLYTGRYSENAAFNPSLSPLQGALIAMVADGKSWNDISRVALVQKARNPLDVTIQASGHTNTLPVNTQGVDQTIATWTVLNSVCPNAQFDIRHVG